MLADVLRRDGATLSATETLRSELSAADHLGVLGTVWYDLARQAQATRFEQSLRESLPEAEADAAVNDPACTWLWRSLREADSAGLDPDQVLREAVAARSLAGARDAARVIDARVRRMIEHTVPSPASSWSERVPQMGDPELDRYMTELAAAMDDRVRRIGEHIAQTRPVWATQALGEVPADAVARVSWEKRAAQIGAYRELYGYDAQGDAIGPEPGKTSPEARADWHAAFAALGRVEGIDLRGCSDGQLRLRRSMYERETSWAPPHVAEELRLARLQARTAWENAIRADHEVRAAKDADTAGRHQTLAGMWRAMEDKANSVAGTLADAQETRRQWEAFTEPSRRMAQAADLELRRRTSGMVLEPLKSADVAGIGRPERGGQPAPERVPAPRQEVWVQGTFDGGAHLAEADEGKPAAQAGQPLPSSAERDAYAQQALGLTPETVAEEIPEQVIRIQENVRSAQEKIDRLRTTPQFDEHDDSAYEGPAWGDLARRERDAILQPPKPDVVPASEIARRAQERQAGAADADAADLEHA